MSRWIVQVQTLTDEQLAAELSYVNTKGQTRTVVRGLALAQVFNHGTHHRGQMTGVISKLPTEVLEFYPDQDMQLMGDEFTLPAEPTTH